MVLHLRGATVGRYFHWRKVSPEPRESRGCPKGAVGWLLIEAVGRMQKICTLTSDFLLVPSIDSNH